MLVLDSEIELEAFTWLVPNRFESIAVIVISLPPLFVLFFYEGTRSYTSVTNADTDSVRIMDQTEFSKLLLLSDITQVAISDLL
jgi:hypothetical protein